VILFEPFSFAAILGCRDSPAAFPVGSIGPEGHRVPAGQPTGLLHWRRAGPVLLRNGIWPCRAWWLELQPSLSELAALERVIVHNEAQMRSLLPRLGNRRVEILSHQAGKSAVARTAVQTELRNA
jgi:hypothetical protein